MVTGGLRTIEVSRANIGDLRTLGDNSVLYVQGKGREEKTDYIKLSAPAEQAIRAYLKARGEKDEKAPLFSSTSNNNKGARLTTRSVSGIVKTRLQQAGYDSEKLTAHSLRHTAVTLSLLAGKDITEVQQFARHANIATTMIYNHALDKAKNGCSEAITQAIMG
jgi:integrase/recombinase XerC